MASGVARVGDTVTGFCNGPGHKAGRAFTGAWQVGSPYVQADGLAVIRVGDAGITDCGHTFYAESGSSIALADGLGLHRVGDSCVTEGGGTGTTITGSTVVTVPS